MNKQKIKFWAPIIVLTLAVSYIVFFVATKTELFKGFGGGGDAGGELPGTCPEGNLKITNVLPDESDLIYTTGATNSKITATITYCDLDGTKDTRTFDTYIRFSIDRDNDGSIDDRDKDKEAINDSIVSNNTIEKDHFFSQFYTGEHKVTACIDNPKNTDCMSDTSRPKSTIVFAVRANETDPWIDSVYITPNKPEIGENTIYSAVIKNPGTGSAAVTVNLDIFDGKNITFGTQTANVPSNLEAIVEWNARMIYTGSTTALYNISEGSENNFIRKIYFTVEADSTDPTATITVPVTNAIVQGNTVMISANATDAVGVTGVQFKLDGTDLVKDTTSPYSATWNTANTNNGAHTLTAIAEDAAGNRETSAAVNVTVDNNVPTVAITAPANNSSLRTLAAITGTANDATSSVTTVNLTLKRNSDNQYWNGSTWQSSTGALIATGTSSWTWTSGTSWATTNTAYTITATATDAAGNASSQATSTFTYDTTAPTVALWEATTNPTVKTLEIPIYLNFHENISGLVADDFAISGGNIVQVSGGPNHFTVKVNPTSTDTQNNITVHLNANAVNDAAGNANATATSDVTINFYPTPSLVQGTSPSNDTTPNITVGNGASGLTAHIYSDASCNNHKGSADMTAATMAVTSTNISANTTYYAVFTDADSNESACSTANFAYVYDATAPTLAVVTAVPTLTNDTTPNFTFSSTEAGQITYGGSCASTTTTASAANNTVTFNALAAGTYTDCTIKVTDTAGNQSNILTLASFTVDATPPTSTSISINNGSSHTNTRNVTLTLSATDAGSGMGTGAQMQFSNDNSTWSAAEAYVIQKEWELTSGDGNKTVYVKFKDAVGNWSNAVNDTITLDTTAPEGITITYPNNGATVGGNVNITAEGDAELVKIEFRINGTKRYEDTDGSDGYSYSWDTKTIPGTKITAVGYDAAGSPTFAEINVIVDNTPPVISALAADPTDYTATITWTTNEPADTQLQYKKSADNVWQTTDLADADPRITAHTVELAGLTQGTRYEIKALSKDSVGNLTESPLTFTTESQSPIGWWKLDEGSEGTINDSSANNFNGSKSGGTWVISGERAGLFLDGVNDYVEIPDPGDSLLDLGNAATIAAWVKYTKGGWAFINKENSYEFGITSENPDDAWPDGELAAAFAGNTGWQWVTSGTVIPKDTWTHVAVMYDGTNVTFFVNGEQVGEPLANINFHREPSTGPLRNTTHSLRFGARDVRLNTPACGSGTSNDANCNGQDGIADHFTPATLSDVQIYNRVLSPEEISAFVRRVNITQPALGAGVTGSVDVRIETDSGATGVEFYVGGEKYADAVFVREEAGKKIFSVAWDTAERGLAGQIVNREIFARALYTDPTAPLDSGPITLAVQMPAAGRSNFVRVTPPANTTALTGIIPVEIFTNIEAQKTELMVNGVSHEILTGEDTASGKKFTYQWDTSTVSGFGLMENIRLSAKATERQPDGSSISWESDPASPLLVSVQRPAQVVVTPPPPVKKVTVAAGQADIQDLSLTPGSNAFIVPITVAVASSIPNDTETKITGFTLNYTGDFPHSKITEPAIFLSTSPVDDATITKATQNGNITVRFAGTSTPLTSPKRFLLYVKANVAEADAGKFIQYKVSPITVTPADRQIVYAKALGEQLTVAETLVAALTCPAPKVKSGAACACPAGTYDYTGETFYAGLSCIPCTAQELRDNGGFICPQHFRQAAATGSGSSGASGSAAGGGASGGAGGSSGASGAGTGSSGASGGASSGTGASGAASAAAAAGLSPEDRQLLSFFQTCQLQKKFTYTGPSKPGTSRVQGMCIECPTEIYEAYAGSCTAPATVVAVVELPKPPRRTPATGGAPTSGAASGAASTGRQAASGTSSGGSAAGAASAQQTGAAGENAAGATAGATQTGAASFAGTGARSVAGTPGLRGSTRLIRAPERGQEGPAAALYLAVLPAAWVLRKIRGAR